VGESTHPILRDHIFIGDLSPDAQEAIRISVAKFRKGADEHGPLDVLKGNWTKAFLEELIDGHHYLIFQLMKLDKGGA
jgi:hypothetical protein